jgi:hypothetical protein
MGDNRRVIAKPPIGSVNNKPLINLRKLEAPIWREVFEHRQNADRIGPVGIAVLCVFAAGAIALALYNLGT